MPPSDENFRAAHSYAWEWFKFHADQRLKVFQFFLVLSGALFAAYVGVNNSDNYLAGLALGILMFSSSILFWRLDTRNTELIKNSEAALRITEAEFATTLGEAFKLAEISDTKQTDFAKKNFPKFMYSYKQLVGAWYILIVVASIMMIAFNSYMAIQIARLLVMKRHRPVKKCDNKSAGVLVWDEGRLLLIQRNTFPYGFAVPAGHVDNHGDYEDAAKAELHEEVGILATSLRLEIEGFAINPCRRIGGNHHYWKIYSTQVFDLS